VSALRVWIPRKRSAAFDAELEAALDPTVELAVGEARPDPAAYEVLVSGRPSAEDLDASPDLRMLVIPWAGLPTSTAGLLRARRRLAVHNLHHNAPATAEMAVGLLLAAARKIVPADRALRRGDWRIRYDTDGGLRLVGRRALVLGYGAIGRRVARTLLAFDVDVTAVRRKPSSGGEAGVRLVGPDALDARLPTAEVLVVCLPSTEATRRLLDAKRIGMLPRNSLLVNVARGDIVDEDALFEALQTGRLAGAGLDVWWKYPESDEARSDTLPSTRPFHELDNVVLSPHRAGHGEGTERARAAALAHALNAAAAGREVPHRVDLDLGY
jgi:phosphoglycerate dehydrogenase-like enzyme